MIRTEAIETIIATLEHAQARPVMFTSSAVSVEAMTSFINGFGLACLKLGYRYNRETYEAAFTQRGWCRFENRAEPLSEKSGKNMKDTGMSDNEIIHELFAIEIDCWKILRDASPAL